MRLIIAGGRDFNDYELLKRKCDRILRFEEEIEIVSGGASGADFYGNKYAVEKGYDVKYFPADWSNLGKAAGPIRNEKMAEYSDALIAFWDGESKGTSSMIELAKQYGLKVRIINYSQHKREGVKRK